MKKIVLLDTNKFSTRIVTMIEELVVSLGYIFIAFPQTSITEARERCLDTEIVLVNKNPIDEDFLKQLPHLKYIIVLATGYDNVDVAAAKKYHVKVSNIPGYSTKTVAQHAMALLLELTDNVGNISNQIRQNHSWKGVKHTILELSGLTLGVIGFGSIAQQFIKLAQAFELNVIVHSRRTNYETDLAVKFVDKETLFKTSDIISLHCSLNEETYNIINKHTLNQMKSSAILVNVSRGGLVNEDDLADALNKKEIKAALLDVLKLEPPLATNRLLGLDNCIITPHHAWISDAALQRWLDITKQHIRNFEHNTFNYLV